MSTEKIGIEIAGIYCCDLLAKSVLFSFIKYNGSRYPIVSCQVLASISLSSLNVPTFACMLESYMNVHHSNCATSALQHSPDTIPSTFQQRHLPFPCIPLQCCSTVSETKAPCHWLSLDKLNQERFQLGPPHKLKILPSHFGTHA